MANVTWDMTLSADQRGQPVLRHRQLALPDTIGRFPEMLETMFPSTKHSLKTWGRTPGADLAMDPHWIGVRSGGPLHTDKAYPRFTHQIVVNADPGFVVRGLHKIGVPVQRGTFFVLDTHSPHQLYAESGHPTWYLALSVDTRTDTVLDKDIIALLLQYGASFVFTDADAKFGGMVGGQKTGGSRQAKR